MAEHLMKLPMDVINYIRNYTCKNCDEPEFTVKIISLYNPNLELDESNIKNHPPILMITSSRILGSKFMIFGDENCEYNISLDITSPKWNVTISGNDLSCNIKYIIEKDGYLFDWNNDSYSMCAQLFVPAKYCKDALLLYLSSIRVINE